MKLGMDMVCHLRVLDNLCYFMSRSILKFRVAINIRKNETPVKINFVEYKTTRQCAKHKLVHTQLLVWRLSLMCHQS